MPMPTSTGDQSLPEPATWLANAVIGTLRQWMHDGPFRDTIHLARQDIDQLESFARELAESHRATASCLVRNRIEVREYPVRIGGADMRPVDRLKPKREHP